MAVVSVATLGAYMLGPSAVAALSSPSHSKSASDQKNAETGDAAAPVKV